MSAPLSNELIQEEERIFREQVQQVQQWWKKDRFRLVTRPYTAEDGNGALTYSCQQTWNST